MKINLRAQGLWEAVAGMGEPGEHEDMAALAALIRAAPPEMVPVLAVKESANEAWEAIKMMRMGIDRVREATAQRLRKEFEQISFKNDESLDSFGMRITGIVKNLRTLGDSVEEVRVV
jgi:glycerol-3-phosphate dehydrogenase